VIRLQLRAFIVIFLLFYEGTLLPSDKYWVFISEESLNRFLGKQVLYDEKAEIRHVKAGYITSWKDFYPDKRIYNKLELYVNRIEGYSRFLGAFSCRINKDRIGELQKLSFVKKIIPVGKYKSTCGSYIPVNIGLRKSANVYGYSYWQLEMLNIPQLHSRGLTGKGIRIALFDTGFMKSHEAFNRLINNELLLAERDFIYKDTEVEDEPGEYPQQWHGTMVLSLISGYVPGVLIGASYDSEIILAKTEDDRSETTIEEDNYIFAIEWADSLGADIISTSLGYRDFDDTTYSFEIIDGKTAPISIAVNEAFKRGIIIVTAAGNDACKYRDGGILTPGDAFGAITVGAVDSLGNIAYFSSHGPTFDGRVKPDVCAMGVYTFGAIDDGVFYGWGSGTSLATPLIAGGCALILQANPNLKPCDVLNILRSSGDRAFSPDNLYGWGIPDISEAVERALVLNNLSKVKSEIIPYPNPAKELINFAVEIGNVKIDKSILSINIYNILGQLVWENKQEIYPVGGYYNLSGLELDIPAGIYLYRVKIDNKVIGSGKFTFFKR